MMYLRVLGKEQAKLTWKEIIKVSMETLIK